MAKASTIADILKQELVEENRRLRALIQRAGRRERLAQAINPAYVQEGERRQMAIIMGKLYTALKAAGADEAQAVCAAEEVASYENRLSAIEAKLTRLTWILGFNIAASVGILIKLLVT